MTFLKFRGDLRFSLLPFLPILSPFFFSPSSASQRQSSRLFLLHPPPLVSTSRVSLARFISLSPSLPPRRRSTSTRLERSEGKRSLSLSLLLRPSANHIFYLPSVFVPPSSERSGLGERVILEIENWIIGFDVRSGQSRSDGQSSCLQVDLKSQDIETRASFINYIYAI